MKNWNKKELGPNKFPRETGRYKEIPRRINFCVFFQDESSFFQVLFKISIKTKQRLSGEHLSCNRIGNSKWTRKIIFISKDNSLKWNNKNLLTLIYFPLKPFLFASLFMINVGKRLRNMRILLFALDAFAGVFVLRRTDWGIH